MYIEFIKFACVFGLDSSKSGRVREREREREKESHASQAGQNPHMDLALCSMHTQRLGNLLNLERAHEGNGKYTI
jgi:hypothetical protein